MLIQFDEICQIKNDIVKERVSTFNDAFNGMKVRSLP